MDIMDWVIAYLEAVHSLTWLEVSKRYASMMALHAPESEECEEKRRIAVEQCEKGKRTCAVRLGADRFGMLMGDVNALVAEQWADRLRAAVDFADEGDRAYLLERFAELNRQLGYETGSK